MDNVNKTLKVVAYCRVSTDKDDQINSLESQKKYFTEYINRNSNWELVKVYADEGVTGTSTKKRHAFNEMIDDAFENKFNMIITKEISRFARNTLDSIYYTRKLKELGIGVIFLNDNINTLDSDAELRLTIMSSIAQEESRKTSERVQWGQKRSMEQGVVFGRDMLGYDVRNGKMNINEQGAETVRLIFHKFVNENKGTHVIANELKAEGVPTSKYMKQWSNIVVLRILKNEKYCGDLIQRKTYTPSYLNHQKKYNKGEVKFIVIRNHHEAIIDRDMFEKAQMELERRALTEKEKSKYSNRYCLSGKIKCGKCGKAYISRTKPRKDGSIYRAWRCSNNAKNGSTIKEDDGQLVGCDNASVNEEDLKLILLEDFKSKNINKNKMIIKLTNVLNYVLNIDDEKSQNEKAKNKIDNLKTKENNLIELFLNMDIGKDRFTELYTKFDDEIKSIENKMTDIKSNKNKSNTLEKSVEFINNIINADEWDDDFYRNIIDSIVVYADKTYEIKLKFSKYYSKYTIE